jgi:hypothetical protein
MQTPARTGQHDDDDHDDDYFDLDRLARYSRLSLTTLRRYLKHPTHPLPHRRIGAGRGRIIVARSAFTVWFNGFPGVAPRDPVDPIDDISWVRRALRKD